MRHGHCQTKILLFMHAFWRNRVKNVRRTPKAPAADPSRSISYPQGTPEGCEGGSEAQGTGAGVRFCFVPRLLLFFLGRVLLQDTGELQPSHLAGNVYR